MTVTSLRHSLSSQCNTAELALPLIPNHPTLDSTCITEDEIFLLVIIIIIIAVFSVSILNQTKTSITHVAQDYLPHSQPSNPEPLMLAYPVPASSPSTRPGSTCMVCAEGWVLVPGGPGCGTQGGKSTGFKAHTGHSWTPMTPNFSPNAETPTHYLVSLTVISCLNEIVFGLVKIYTFISMTPE